MNQKVLFRIEDEVLIIFLPEELDHHTAGVIRKETDMYFTAKKVRNVIFDYKDTHFMDSSGIGLIMGRYREVRYLRGDIYIVGVNDKIARILEISGLYRVAKVEENVEVALSTIRSKSNGM